MPVGGERVDFTEALADAARDAAVVCVWAVTQRVTGKPAHQDKAAVNQFVGIVERYHLGNRDGCSRAKQTVQAGLLAHHVSFVKELDRVSRRRDAEHVPIVVGINKVSGIELARWNTRETDILDGAAQVPPHARFQYLGVQYCRVFHPKT